MALAMEVNTKYNMVTRSLIDGSISFQQQEFDRERESSITITAPRNI